MCLLRCRNEFPALKLVFPTFPTSTPLPHYSFSTLRYQHLLFLSLIVFPMLSRHLLPVSGIGVIPLSPISCVGLLSLFFSTLPTILLPTVSVFNQLATNLAIYISFIKPAFPIASEATELAFSPAPAKGPPRMESLTAGLANPNNLVVPLIPLLQASEGAKEIPMERIDSD